MPFSTSSAVQMPGSVRPSSTSVIATAGCMPTSTVSASMIFDRPEMVPIMRPMNESTMSSAEISMRTPRAEVLLMRSDRSSCSVMASWSCMSTWMVTRRKAPIWRMGMRSTSVRLRDGKTRTLQCERERIRKIRLRHDALQVEAEMHDGLRDLRTHAADDGIGTHEADGRHGLQQMLGDQGVDGRHAGDVDDGDFRTGFHDALEQRL